MITIYGKLGCPPCLTAQRLCKEAGVPYEYKLLNDSQAIVDELFIRKPDVSSVPACFYGNKFIGGIVKLRFELETIKKLMEADSALSDSDAIDDAVNDSDVGYDEFQDDYIKAQMIGGDDRFDRMPTDGEYADSDGDGYLDSDGDSDAPVTLSDSDSA